MSSCNRNVSIRELEITSLRAFKCTPVSFSQFNQALSHEIWLHYPRRMEEIPTLHHYIYMYLILGYLAWFLSVMYANVYWLNTRHTMTKSAQGKKVTSHENSGYRFTSEAKRVKLLSLKCKAEIHIVNTLWWIYSHHQLASLMMNITKSTTGFRCVQGTL